MSNDRLKKTGLEPTLSSNGLLKIMGLKPTLSNDRLKITELESTLSNDRSIITGLQPTLSKNWFKNEGFDRQGRFIEFIVDDRCPALVSSALSIFNSN